MGRVHFVHRTFEEFLAAKAAMDAGDIGLLIDKADDDQWWEVIILAAGLARPKDREDLIQGLIRRGDEDKKTDSPLRYQLHLLAVACLEASVELSPDISREVQKRLARLMPPSDRQAANALAQARDLAVPYLKYDETYSGGAIDACVYALVQIGSEAAVEALKTYVAEDQVLQQLFDAADTFDRQSQSICFWSGGTSSGSCNCSFRIIPNSAIEKNGSCWRTSPTG